MDNEMEILLRNLRANMYIQKKTQERIRHNDTVESVILIGLFMVALFVCSYLY